MTSVADVTVIGGGINGCGIAADAALRGLSVVLIEKDDIASKTSSSSSKLVHGGLRYLEHYNFSLVKKALSERQTLLDLAPHLIQPLRFVIPYQKNIRPAWLVRIGLFLYDNLSKSNKLPKSAALSRSDDPIYFQPLVESFEKGFLFYDGRTDDARLTIANALQAHEYGASILPRTSLLTAKTVNNLWELQLRTADGNEKTIRSKVVINATGPWVESINHKLNIPQQHHMSLVKGSHIVIPKLYAGDHAYLLQNTDKRIVFVIPYFGQTMIGTTDIPFNGDLEKICISQEEIHYLLTIINNYFNQQVSSTSILTSWSGVRPLLAQKDKQPQALSRDYQIEYSQQPAPALSIYGGKITVYRQLAKEAVDKLMPLFPELKSSPTHMTPLPGAYYQQMNFKDYSVWAQQKYTWLDAAIFERLLHTYGSRMELILDGCNGIDDLGIHFGEGLYQKEVDYLKNYEWAHSSMDILWRRTKLGLNFPEDKQAELNHYLQIISAMPFL